MGKIRLVLFGSMGVAVDCLEWLLLQPEYELLGVVCSLEAPAPWRQAVNDRNMREEVERLGVRVLTLEDLEGLDRPDIGLSMRFHQILKRRHLDCFRLGVVNFHGAPLPEYRGAMALNAALLQGDPTFGVTLHWMDTGIDSGDILVMERFEVEPHETAYDVFKRCNDTGLRLVKQHFGEIARGERAAESQAAIIERTGCESKNLLRSEVVPRKRVLPCESPEQLWKAARAFQFPGHEPAYIETAQGKVYLTIKN